MWFNFSDVLFDRSFIGLCSDAVDQSHVNQTPGMLLCKSSALK